jgi:hypothetical protein
LTKLGELALVGLELSPPLRELVLEGLDSGRQCVHLFDDGRKRLVGRLVGVRPHCRVKLVRCFHRFLLEVEVVERDFVREVSIARFLESL